MSARSSDEELREAALKQQSTPFLPSQLAGATTGERTFSEQIGCYVSLQGSVKLIQMIDAGIIRPEQAVLIERPTMYEGGASQWQFYQRLADMDAFSRSLGERLGWNPNELVDTKRLEILNEGRRKYLEERGVQVHRVVSFDEINRKPGDQRIDVSLQLPTGVRNVYEEQQLSIPVPSSSNVGGKKPVVVDCSANQSRIHADRNLARMKSVDVSLHATNFKDTSRGPLSISGSAYSAVTLAVDAVKAGRKVFMADIEGFSKVPQLLNDFVTTTFHDEECGFIKNPQGFMKYDCYLTKASSSGGKGLLPLTVESIQKGLQRAEEEWASATDDATRKALEPGLSVLRAQQTAVERHLKAHPALNSQDVVVYVNDNNEVQEIAEHINCIGYDPILAKDANGWIVVNTHAQMGPPRDNWMVGPNVWGSGRTLNAAQEFLILKGKKNEQGQPLLSKQDRINLFEELMASQQLHVGMQEDFVLWAQKQGVTLEPADLEKVWLQAKKINETPVNDFGHRRLADTATLFKEAIIGSLFEQGKIESQLKSDGGLLAAVKRSKEKVEDRARTGSLAKSLALGAALGAVEKAEPQRRSNTFKR